VTCTAPAGSVRGVRLRSVGNSGLRVSVVGLGTVRFGQQLDLDQAREVVDAALESGITLIDTADAYGGGRSEEILGRVLQGRRDDVVLSTKFGANMGTRYGRDFGARASRRYIVRAVEGSLRRLRTDYIDLYQLHMPDHITPIEETLAALDMLVAQGKVRYAGSSHLDAWQVGEADWLARDRALSRFVSVQDHYSLLNREPEESLLPVCREHGVGFLAFFPLATGLLTGRWSRGEPLQEGSRMWQCRSLGLASAESATVVDQLQKFAGDHDVSVVDVAIGWLAAQPGVSAVIAGASTPDQVRANAAAGDYQPGPADVAEIGRIAATSGLPDPHADSPARAGVSARDGESGVSHETRRRAARCLLEGTAFDDVVTLLSAEGVGAETATRMCQQLLTDPVFEAGMVMTERLRKLESVLSMRQAMRDLTDFGSDIERRSGVSTEEFLEIYYTGNLPVILTDVSDSWPARSLWTPEYLLETLGDVDVEVMTGRESDPRYEVNSNQHKEKMSFSDYVRLIGSRDGNDAYIVANNHLLESPAAAPLLRDFTPDPRYLDPNGGMETCFLWLGPAGTVTPLHHDVVNVFFTQVVGAKRFTLISPLETHCVYNDVAVYSRVDARAPDLERFPRFASTRRFECTIAAGEALFIPVGWWHQVESLSQSASISFTSFLFPNVVDWFHPQDAY
jgi:aryl-alcohol dehydrogenase-like predicted oxidoreductase